MKCPICGHATKTVVEPIRWDALPSAVLVGVEVSTCGNCGERTLTYPSMGPLVETVQRAVIAKAGRLAGEEIRFLRSCLDLDGSELAEALGSTPSTVSKWEHDKQPIGRHADLFLRALTLLQLGGDPTPPSYFAAIAKDITPAQAYRFELDGRTWKQSDAPAPKRKTVRAAR